MIDWMDGLSKAGHFLWYSVIYSLASFFFLFLLLSIPVTSNWVFYSKLVAAEPRDQLHLFEQLHLLFADRDKM